MEKVEISQGAVGFMLGWHRIECLWATVPDSPFEFPPYGSQDAARWALRAMRKQLVEARALAKPAKFLMVHPERFAQALEAYAVQRAIDGVQSAPTRKSSQLEALFQ